MRKFVSYTTLLILISLTGCLNQPKKAAKPVRMLHYGATDSLPALLEIVRKETRLQKVPVLFFTATWCGPCRDLKESLDHPAMADALDGTTLIMIDVDECPDIAGHYKISVIPNLVRIDWKGKVLDAVNGGDWEQNTPAEMAPVIARLKTDIIDLAAPQGTDESEPPPPPPPAP